MTKFFHRFVACLMACLLFFDPGLAAAFSGPSTPRGNLPACAAAYGEQAVVAGMTEWIQSLDVPARLLSIHRLRQPVILRLREKGWSDTRIVAVLGGTEELLFSGVLVSLGSLLLTHVFGISLGHALEITSLISGILFPLSHWKERYRLVGGQLTLAPPNEKKKDLVVLVALGALLRLAYALPLAHLPFGHWNILAAFPIVILGHGIYNGWISPRLGTALGMARKKQADGIEFIHDDEIAIGSTTLFPYVISSSNLQRQVAREAVEAKPEGHFLVLHGIEMVQRRGANNFVVWTIKRTQIAPLAQAFGYVLRNSITVPELADDELHVIGLLSDHLVGDSAGIRRTILKAIDATLPEGDETVLHGITFFRRVHLGLLNWAFKKSDISRVAQAFGYKLRSERNLIPLQNGEVAASAPGLGSVFIGHKAYLLETVQAAIAGAGPNGTEVTVGGVRFFKRLRAGHELWSFELKDREELASHFGFALRPTIDVPTATDQDICITEPIMILHFIGHQSALTKPLKDALQLASPDGQETLIRGIPFYQRKRGTHVAWAFSIHDRQRVAEAFGLTLRVKDAEEPLGIDEIAISQTSFFKLFVAGNLKVAAVRDLIEQSGLDKVETLVQGFKFYRRKVGIQHVWVIKREDIRRFAETFGLELREDVTIKPIQPDTEMRLTPVTMQRLYFGDGTASSRRIRLWIEERAGEAEEAVLEGLHLAYRQIGSVRAWVLLKADEPMLVELFSLIRRADLGLEPVHEDELRISLSSLFPFFAGINGQVLRRIHDQMESRTAELNEITLDGIRFVRRLAYGNPVWTFSERDIDRVGVLFGLHRRIDAQVLVEQLELEEAIALLGDDPLRLKQYIQLYHPELAQDDVDAIAVAGSMRGLRADSFDKEELHKSYAVTLPAPEVRVLELPGLSTPGHAFKVEGKTQPGVRYIQVIGAYTRRIVVRQDGTFSATLPIPRTAELNQYFFYPVIDESRERGEAAEITIHQSGNKEDTEAAFLRLLALKEDVLESIRKNPARYYFLLHTLAQSLLRHFTYSEADGFEYLAQRIKSERSKALQEMLRAVQEEFRDIARMPMKLRSGQKLYFFQKYTVYKVRKILSEKDPLTQKVSQGVIIANEQGLGKTVTALVIVNGREALVITPNTVVSTWVEQEEKFMTTARLEMLTGSYAEREEALHSMQRSQIVTNVEFMQGMTPERAQALSKYTRMLVIDEADYLGRLASQQSKGTRALEATFRLLLTATPFKKISHIGNLLGFLYPNDPHFKSAIAFGRAFPADNHETLNALFLLMQRHTIRIRKKDVFEEYDPGKPISQQSDRLPKKVEVAPEQMGRFTLLREQCDSIKQLFTDYQAWCQAHRVWVEQAGASQEDKKYKRFKEGFFPKLQALRQIMNDPAYFGEPELESPKHQEMDKIVHHELDGAGNTDRKVIIFCKYVAEVETYLKRYSDFGAIGYYGGLERDSLGYKVDEAGTREYYQVDDYENFILQDGRPVKGTKEKGRPILVLDYQRVLFQNDPRSRILVSTYESGSVGVTLTGAHAVIDDDLAPTYRDQYQADDRAHRIDNDRKKYEVRYYRLQAVYPEDWLKSLDPDLMHDFFEMGTYDQVQYDNLRIQARIFHRIMDGIGHENELTGIRARFLANRMPFLFKGKDAQDTEDAIAPETPEGVEGPTDEGETDDSEFGEDGGSQGLLGFWKPVVPWLQKGGWSDAQIAGALGGTEELLFGGVLVSLGSLLLTHVFGISLGHALEITSFVSGILFPLTHWKARYRLVGGQLTLAPPNEKKKDMLVLTALGAVLRLAYALPLAHLSFGPWNILIALPLAFLGHAAYNAWLAPRLNLSLGMGKSDLQPVGQDEIAVTRAILRKSFVGTGESLMARFSAILPEANSDEGDLQVQGITFFKRKTYGPAWAFHQNDTAAVATLLGLTLRSEAAAPEFIETDEISVSAPSMAIHFLGRPDLLAVQIHNAIGSPPRSQMEVTLGGVSFFRRQRKSRYIWAFHKRDLERVAAHFDRPLRLPEGVPPLADSEVAVSRERIEALFAIKPETLLAALNRDLQTAEPNNTFEIGGIHFEKRAGPRGLVWAFPAAELPLVSRRYDAALRSEMTLQPPQPDDVAVSGPGMTKVFIGLGRRHAKQIQEAIAASTPKGITTTLGGVTYTKRISGGRLDVWTFHTSQIAEVAAYFGLRQHPTDGMLPEPIHPDEIGIVQSNAPQYFIGNPGEAIRGVNKIIDEAKAQGISVTVRGIAFQRRISKPGSNRAFWAFGQQDLNAFAAAFNLKLKSENKILPLKDDERAFGVKFVTGQFTGMKPQRDIPGIHSKLSTLQVDSDNRVVYEGISFFRRVSGNFEIWAVRMADLEPLAAAFGWTLRQGHGFLAIQEDELPVAEQTVTGLFFGTPERMANRIRGALANVPDDQAEADVTGIPFIRRMKANRWIWTFKRADRKRIGEFLGAKIRAEWNVLPLREDEIQVSNGGLKQVFNGAPEELARIVQSALEEAHSGDALTCTIDGIAFTRRTHFAHMLWAFSQSDTARVAARFNFTLRTDAAALIEELGLEDAISLLGNDPLRLKQYIQLYHPELSPEDVDAIAVAGAMRGLRADVQDKDELQKGYDVTLPAPAVIADLPEHSTAGHAFKLSGKTEPGVRYIQVIGAYTRRIVVRQDGTFSATLPIPRTGEPNPYFFYPVIDDAKERGEATELIIHQTGTKEDTEAAFLRLLALKEEVLESIKINPARYHFLLHSVEQSLLRHFTYGEDQGFTYLAERIRQEQSRALKEMLRAVETEFRQIAVMRLNIRANQRLYFFQKYTAYYTNQLLTEPDPVTGRVAQGVIIANEQGLGKTVTALVIINGKEAVIITPNSVVSTWAEQEEKFMPQARMEILEGTYAERETALNALTRPQVAINVEFTQGMTEERAAALSNKAEILVVDEADYLGRLASQQSKGTRMIKSVFRLLLTATPFKKVSHIGNLLGFLYPNDSRFNSSKAFARAFPADNPESLNALFLLMQRHTIRVRKKDVFEEYDPAVPLTQQSDRLPKKVEVDPAQMGRFSLLKEQCDSIRQLFTDYQAWCQAHRVWVEQAGATTEDKKYKRFKEGFFPKLQALRQIMNDPAYFGSPELESPKHLEMDRIVHHELDGDQNADHKVIIFCKYVAEVEAYLKRFESYGAIGYYGDLPRDSNGYKIDAGKKREYYEVDPYENFVLQDGRPIKTTKANGRPIRALDYQRLLFQNDPKSRILVSTYETGSVGVTLTGAHAVIDDDLAPTYRDQYQADDRAHRIDNDRKKYEVRYYRLQATYPESWLKSLDPELMHDYFEMGTYDQVQFDNLRIQSRIFHRIMDGVGNESELVGIRARFLANRMPFLFKGADAQDTEEATAPEIIEGQDAGVEAEAAGETEEESNSQGLLSIWKPLIPWLQERGWSDTRIAGILGGSEEFLFSGVLVSLGSLLLTHIFGMSLTHALEITSFVSGILFPVTHWKERYRLVGGQLTLAPPVDKKKDLLVLTSLGVVLRLAYLLPLLHLPFHHLNVLIALPIAFFGHALYNAWIAPRLKLSLGMAKYALKPVGPDEVPVTQKFLPQYFVGTGGSLMTRFDNMLPELTPDEEEVQIQGITFFKRKTVGPAWAFHQRDIAAVAKSLRLTLRSEVNDPEFNEIQEISVSAPGLVDHFLGRPDLLAIEIHKAIGSPPASQIEVALGGVSFFRRQRKTRHIWAFNKDDVERVAAHFQFRLRSPEGISSLGDFEVPVTFETIEEFFAVKPATLLAAINKDLQTPKPVEALLVAGIHFQKRAGPRGLVWAFPKSELPLVGRRYKVTLRSEVDLQPPQPDEVVVSGPGMAKAFIGLGSQIAKQVNTAIEAKKPRGDKLTLGGVNFAKRVSQGRFDVWTFKADKVSQVAAHFDLKVRPIIGTRAEIILPGEIAISQTDLPKFFVGNPGKLARDINEIIEHSERTGFEAIARGVRLYFRRTSAESTKSSWVVKAQDIDAFAQAFGLKFRSAKATEPLGPDELALVSDTAQRYFSGGIAFLPQMQKSVARQNPTEDGSLTLKGIRFFRRLSGPAEVWAFNKSDLDKLALAWGWTRRHEYGFGEIQPDEIAVTESSIENLFAASASRLIDKIKAAIGNVPDEQEHAAVAQIGMTRRIMRGRTFWAFGRNDVQSLAEFLKVKVRTNAGLLIETLGLEEAVALLGDDPLRLKQYIQLYHPELSPEDVDAVAVAGAMRGLRGDAQDKDELHKGYDVTLPAPSVVADLPEHSTAGHAFTLSGRTVPGVRYIQVIGAYTRKIMVRQDGTFGATLPIPRTGEPNQYCFYPVKDETRERGEAFELMIHQTGTKEDTEAAFLRLLALKEEVLESIKINPARFYFLLHSLEQSLLRHFTYGEDQGFAFLAGRIRQEQSKALKEMLRAVETEFRQIAGRPLNIRANQRLYFFQKYTAYKANHLLTVPDPVTGQVAQGVIIANEQGLGKTVTALVIVNGKEAVIITPNSVVSTWAEQEEKFMPQARMEILEGTYAERQAALRALTRPQVAINVEFTQGMTEERAAALSNKAEILVVDEADYLGRLASQQSKGTRMIKSVFRLLLTATPFKKVSHIGNLLGFLYPNDPRFGSTRAFARAFPADNPESLNALFLLMQRHTIRVRKKDVFEEYDRAVPLTQQSDRLPKKVEVDPARMGRFSLLKEQCDSIRQLFTDYQAWCQAHRVWVEQAGASTEDKKYKRFKEGFFPKLQALRQIMNDPAYFGQPELESPKHLEMDRIVHHELDGKQNADHKVIIFCKYVAEVEAYLKRFESYGAIGYYGDLPRDSNGYKIDAEKNREYYKVDEYENFVLKNGRPVLTDKISGRPIRALDYQRLLFQNDPKSRIMVSTYETGSVGVTLTGAHAVIDDDLAPTYRDQYQADDRAHRIDNDRKKYEVRYYRLQATYPESWLKSLDPELMHDYFEMGTYDQVQFDNLRIQSRIFHRIMDGVGNESELVGIRARFLANRMPFLFQGTDAQDTEEATAPEIVEGQDAGVEAESAGEVDDDGGSQGLLSIWKPLIPWLQARGWSDTRIAGLLGGSEEFLFSGVLVSLGSLLLTHVFGISLTHALEITSFISGILFPLSHWKERYRLVGGQLTLAPPNEKKKDLITLAILGTALRLLYALPLADLPFGHWNTLVALPLAFLGHAAYNTWIAPRLRASLAIMSSAQLAKAA